MGGELGSGIDKVIHEIERYQFPPLDLRLPVAIFLSLLIPCVGAYGDAAATVRAGHRASGPIVVNSSRAILYASPGDDFAAAARRVALQTRAELQAAAVAAVAV